MRFQGTPWVGHLPNHLATFDRSDIAFPLDFAGGVSLPACQRITLLPSPAAATPKGARRG